MELTTVKVSKKNHELVRNLADRTGLGVTTVLDNLIEQGLNTTREIGQVVASDEEWVRKLQDQVDKLKLSYYDVTSRLDDLETEVSEQGGAAVELTKDDLLELEDHEPGKEVRDHTIYYCQACARKGKTVVLDHDEQPDQCPECGDKLNWKPEGSRIGTYLALGALALAFIASRSRAVTRNGLAI